MTKRDTLPIEVAIEPFATRHMDRIFQLDPDHDDRITSRESSWLEFKQSFNWANWEKYARTGAAFANAKGGYIVFGIGDKPRRLLGMSNNHFDEIAPETITKDLNSSFAPALEWQLHSTEYCGKRFGLIFFWESTGKPVIAIANRQEFKEGDILYRYRGKTERIRYPELQSIIEFRQTRNLESWMRFIQKIARIGVDNAAVLDFLDGTISGPGGTLVIDESLIQKIRFIREGKFHERDGAPTLRLIGDVAPVPSNLVQPTRVVDRPVAITTQDIVRVFLDQETPNDALQFIKQICFETSGNLPIYYFMGQAGLTSQTVLEFVQAQNSRKQGKVMLLKRLKSDANCEPEPYKPGTPVAAMRENLIRQNHDGQIAVDKLRYALKAVRTLSKNEIDISYLFPLAKLWFERFYATESSNTATEIRKMLCYLDCILFREVMSHAS